MLDVRKGKSVKAYENEFFRKISVELTQIFEQRQWDGILLGMPVCLEREDLQIDCLLVTENQIIIIDFKNYSGILKLPPEKDFMYGRWRMNGDIPVKGGSSPNPFNQLIKQRRKLIHELKPRLNHFKNKSISTLVCFHDKVEVMGTVPREYQISFAIVDIGSYLNKIVDIIDVTADQSVNYLSEQGRQMFTEMLFAADAYQSDVQFEAPISNPPAENNIAQSDCLEQIQHFLQSDNCIMTLTGNTRSGKTALIPAIREMAFNAEFTDVPVFAYSNRLRRKMLNSHPDLEEVESLFNTVFNFQGETIDEFYKKTIPIKSHDSIHDQEKALYIIDDSQLISNSNFDLELVQFGSGHLLNDVLQYIDLGSHPERKILFIGDTNKLSYGSKDESALNPQYLQVLLEVNGITSEIEQADLLEPEDKSEIVQVCNQISRNLKTSQFNELHIDSGKEISMCAQQEQEKVLEEAYMNPKNSKILVFSNQQAGQVNLWIKKHLIVNGAEISAKDTVIFHSTIQTFRTAWPTDGGQPEQPFNTAERKRVDNGYFGEILHADHAQLIEKSMEINGGTIRLRFIPCKIKLQDESVIETLIFDNYLKSTKSELDKLETIAYQRLLANYENQILRQEPFGSSEEYKEMMQHPGEFTIIKKDGKELYRDPKDKRKLTRYEKTYRERVLKKLHAPGNEYFKILNAARVKYGWAMTVNKAMAYSFDTVFLNANQDENRGRANKEYFKWMYTGISSGLHRVQLINWKPVSPFLKTEFNENSPANSDSKKDIILKLSDGEQTTAEQLHTYLDIQLSGVAAVSNIVSRNYLEMVSLEMNGRKLELFFDYNGKGEMKMPRLKSGEEEDFAVVLRHLQTTIQDALDEPGSLSPFLQRFSTAIEKYGIQTQVTDTREWQVQLRFADKYNHADAHLWYNGQGMISTFTFKNGSKDIFSKVVGYIKDIYGLE